MKGTETIKDKKGKIIAIIIYGEFKAKGTNFFTPGDFSQQLAFIERKKGDVIKAHSHKKIKIHVRLTQETLFIKKGKIKVDLYDDKRKHLVSKTLKAGDTILLASGGHGFKALENLEMIEVKQGPYLSDSYKVIFK